jgi:hypothetical protein
MAHRVSWFIRYGKIPAKMLVLHSCDRRLCVNPDHLFLGNDTENMRDRTAKGRGAKGEDYPQSKLTEKDVIEIRRVYQDGLGRRLAKKYSVAPCTILKIINGESWRHVLASPPSPAPVESKPCECENEADLSDRPGAYIAGCPNHDPAADTAKPSPETKP